MLSSIVFLMLSAAPAPAEPAAVPPAATVDVAVTDRQGRPLRSARVLVAGLSEREGTTDARGRVVFKNMLAGDYKLEVQRDAFISFEKEFTVAPGESAVRVAAALSPAAIPASAPRASDTPISEPPMPQVVSIPDLARKELLGQGEVKESPIGCSGLTGARLIQVTEAAGEPTRVSAEELLYVVDGEATLSVDGRSEQVESGWLSIIPSGTTYALSRKGQKPVVVLSVVGGQQCARAAQAHAPR